MSKNVSVKERMLNALKQTEGQNTFTTKQAQARFGIKNVSARINELRKDGHCIYTNTKKLADGTKVNYYRLGKPSREIVAFAVAAGYSFGE